VPDELISSHENTCLKACHFGLGTKRVNHIIGLLCYLNYRTNLISEPNTDLYSSCTVAVSGTSGPPTPSGQRTLTHNSFMGTDTS
jgi:hypothetical protein